MTRVAGGILLRGSTPSDPGGLDGDLDDRRRAARSVRRLRFRKRVASARRRLRGGTSHPERPDRPSARRDRAVRRRDRHRRGREARTIERARDLGPRGRSQRRGTCGRRRRPDDRPLADEGDPRRSRRADGTSAGRRPLGRAQPRGACARARRDRRRDLVDGHRGLHARRWPRLVDGEARPRLRQPARRRARHRRRRDPERRRREPSRPDVGAPRRRRQLRRGCLARVPPAPRLDGHRRADRAPDRRGG